MRIRTIPVYSDNYSFLLIDDATTRAAVVDPADPAAAPRAACWFDPECVEIRIDPPDDSPYCLTVYLLDYDRNGRAQKVIVSSGQRILDEREFLAEEMERGVYLSWESEGSVVVRFRKGTGANAVISGVFADRPD